MNDDVTRRRSRNRSALLLLILALHVGASAWAVRERYALPRIEIGEEIDAVPILAEAELVSQDRSPMIDADVIERPGVVVLWATWCRACKRVWNALNAGRRHGMEFPVTAVALADDQQAIEAYLKKTPIPARIARTREPTPMSFGVRTIPLVLVVDADGRLVAAFRSLDQKRLRDLHAWSTPSTP